MGSLIILGLIMLAQLAAPPPDKPTLADAQHLFYSGSYEASAALALTLEQSGPEMLAAHELRTSALHFQIKRAMGEGADKDAALRSCGVCAALIADFSSDFTAGQALSRSRLLANPADENARFFLGKLDLNYVWLHLGTLGRRTGWSEFREARRSLDEVLQMNPTNCRARVAHAWIEYIVDTRVPHGVRWLLGGGNKKHGLAVVMDVARTEADFYIRTEAAFGLWEMQIREHDFTGAAVTARVLARDFPENRELAKFLAAHG